MEQRQYDCSKKSNIRGRLSAFVSQENLYADACQYREELPRFPITQVARREPRKPIRLWSRLSTLKTVEVLVGYRGRLVQFRGVGCPWHIITVVRSRKSRNKRRYFFCPRCCGQGRMCYLTGPTTYDVACEHCVPLPSINDLLTSKMMLNMRYALKIRDYETAAAIMKTGPKGTLVYKIARETGLEGDFGEQYIADLQKNDKRHLKLLKRTHKSTFMRVKRKPGRLIYAEGTLILR